MLQQQSFIPLVSSQSVIPFLKSFLSGFPVSPVTAWALVAKGIAGARRILQAVSVCVVCNLVPVPKR